MIVLVQQGVCVSPWGSSWDKTGLTPCRVARRLLGGGMRDVWLDTLDARLQPFGAKVGHCAESTEPGTCGALGGQGWLCAGTPLTRVAR